MPELRPITWLGDSRLRLREAHQDVRERAGQELQMVQRGRTPKDYRFMSEVGPGVMEIRVHHTTEFRVFYVARFEETIYVLPCFEKKTQKTRKSALDLGKERYQRMIEMRRTT